MMASIIYFVCAALFMGLIHWGLKSAKTVGWVSFGVFCVYILAIIVIVYFGSAERKENERQFILKKIAKQKV